MLDGMRIYSDYPARRAAQIIADVLAIATIVVGFWLGTVVNSAIAALAEVGRQLESAGAGFEGAMADAGSALGRIPLVGEAVRAPFDSASGTGGLLEDAGRSTQDLVIRTAMVIGVLVTALVVFAVCWIWLRRRIGFIRRATEAGKLVRIGDGADLLALRALVNGTRQELAAIDRHPVDAWRRGDPAITRRLAELELREAGVRLR